MGNIQTHTNKMFSNSSSAAQRELEKYTKPTGDDESVGRKRGARGGAKCGMGQGASLFNAELQC